MDAQELIRLYQTGERAFRSTDLSRTNLIGVDLSDIDLSGANLSGADLSEANLSGANLSAADLSEANLSKANLNSAGLWMTNLTKAILCEADLSEALLQCNLSGANLSRAYLDLADLGGANLSGANLSESHLYRAKLRGADLSKANLNGAKITEDQLNSVESLEGATMPDGTKYGSNEEVEVKDMTTVEWKLKSVTRNEVKPLQEIGLVPADIFLPPANVWLVLPIGEKISNKSQALTLRNTFFKCGVCKQRSQMPDFQLGVSDSLFMEPDIPNVYQYRCPDCGSRSDIMGIETHSADESPRYWIVIKSIDHSTSYPVNSITESSLELRKFSVEIYSESGPLPESETRTVAAARVAITETNTLSEGKINLVSQGKSVPVAKEDLPTTSVSSLTSLGSSLGIRFDIDKIESKSSGLYGYGIESWKVFWQVIDSQRLKGATLLEGDTSATLSGRENVYCIAVQASNDTLNEIKTTLEQSSEFQQVAASVKFIEGGDLAGEPLMEAGQVDLMGNFVGEENIPPHTAFGIVQKKKQSSSVTAPPSPPRDKLVEQLHETKAEVVQKPQKKWWQFWK